MLHNFSPEIIDFLLTSCRVYVDVCIHVFLCVYVCVCVREYDSNLRRFALSFAL